MPNLTKVLESGPHIVIAPYKIQYRYYLSKKFSLYTIKYLDKQRKFWSLISQLPDFYLCTHQPSCYLLKKFFIIYVTNISSQLIPYIHVNIYDVYIHAYSCCFISWPCGICDLSSLTRIESVSPALVAQTFNHLTTGPPGSPHYAVSC